MLTAVTGINWGDEGKGKDFLQNAGQHGHGQDHGQKDQHVGGDGPPGRIGDRREARGQQGMIGMRGPEAAHQRHHPGHFAHKTVHKAPPGEKDQRQDDDQIKNILPHMRFRQPPWRTIAEAPP